MKNDFLRRLFCPENRQVRMKMAAGFLIGIAVLGGLEAMRHMIERKTAQNADKPLPAAKNRTTGDSLS